MRLLHYAAGYFHRSRMWPKTLKRLRRWYWCEMTQMDWQMAAVAVVVESELWDLAGEGQLKGQLKGEVSGRCCGFCGCC